MVHHRPEGLVSSMLSMRKGVGGITIPVHLSFAEWVALAPGPARSAFSALRKAKRQQPLCMQYVYDNTWRSCIGGLRRTGSGHGHLRSMTCRKTGTMRSEAAKYYSGGRMIPKRVKPSVQGAKHVDASSLLVILHYLLKNNKERSKWI